MTALRRLLKHPHRSVFDTSPEDELALRLRHPDGAAWTVADETLTVTVGQAVHVYDLATLSIAGLVTRLRDDGFEVLDVSPTFYSMSASVLVEGSNSQGRSNGDHLTGFKSLMWALFGGYARELRIAKAQIPEALRQMIITEAEGEWLDLYGALYDQPRKSGQADPEYAQYIPREAFRKRLNAKAIEKAILEQTGKDVRIDEPWRLMFRLDQSALSGTHHLHDSAFYTPFIIQPVSNEPFDMDEVIKIVERNKAAGVIVHAPALIMPTRHVSFGDNYKVGKNREDTYVIGAWAGGERPLGVMRLDNNKFNFNHRVQAFQIIAISNDDGLQTEQDFGKARNVAVASIALSAGVPLGDKNAILSRGRVHYDIKPRPTLSGDLAMSDIKSTKIINRVERITIDTHGIRPVGSLAGVVSDGRTDTYAIAAANRAGENTWTGTWGQRNWNGWRDVGMKMTTTSA